MFNTIYPEYIVETKENNSRLNKAVEQISNDGNLYYIMLDTAIDNPDVLRESIRLKRNISGKNNVRVIKIHSFEFALLSFEYLDSWVFAVDDDFREKRKGLLDARDKFVELINNGGDRDSLSNFKSVYNYKSEMNSEKISAKLLFEITRNTGFETNKSKVGSCFIENCCELDNRQDDDKCGLDNNRLTVSEKMEQIMKYSVLQKAIKEANLK